MGLGRGGAAMACKALQVLWNGCSQPPGFYGFRCVAYALHRDQIDSKLPSRNNAQLQQTQHEIMQNRKIARTVPEPKVLKSCRRPSKVCGNHLIEH